MKIIIRITFSIFLLIIASCQFKTSNIKQGYFKLKPEDVKNHEVIALDGEWEFYWQKSLNPEDFQNGPTPIPDIYIPVNDIPWNGFVLSNDVTIPGEGYATYRLKIDLPEDGDWGIRFNIVFTSYQLWINSEYMEGVGSPGTNSENTVPLIHPKEYYFSGNKCEIILQAANYDYRIGGLYQLPLIGKQETIQIYAQKRALGNVFLIGIALFFGLFHLILFLTDKKNIFSLFVFLISVNIIFRLIGMSEFIIFDIFPNAKWEVLIMSSHLTTYSLPFLIVGFFYFYTKDIPKWFLFTTTVYSLIFILFTFILPSSINTNNHFIAFSLSYIIYIYLIILIIQKERKEVKRNIILYSGFIILILFYISDSLYILQLAKTGLNIHFGLIFFMLAITIDFSLKMKNSTNSNKKTQSQDLQTIISSYGLTTREFDVVQKLIQGKSYNAIAKEIGISYNTVKTHVQRIYEKLKVTSKYELMQKFKEK